MKVLVTYWILVTASTTTGQMNFDKPNVNYSYLKFNSERACNDLRGAIESEGQGLIPSEYHRPILLPCIEMQDTEEPKKDTYPSK